MITRLLLGLRSTSNPAAVNRLSLPVIRSDPLVRRVDPDPLGRTGEVWEVRLEQAFVDGDELAGAIDHGRQFQADLVTAIKSLAESDAALRTERRRHEALIASLTGGARISTLSARLPSAEPRSFA